MANIQFTYPKIVRKDHTTPLKYTIRALKDLPPRASLSFKGLHISIEDPKGQHIYPKDQNTNPKNQIYHSQGTKHNPKDQPISFKGLGWLNDDTLNLLSGVLINCAPKCC